MIQSEGSTDTPQTMDLPLAVEIPSSHAINSAGSSSAHVSDPASSSRAISIPSPASKARKASVDHNASWEGNTTSHITYGRHPIGSPDIVDRVFPIRSVVSVDPTQTPSVASERDIGERREGYFPGDNRPGSAGSNHSGSKVSHIRQEVNARSISPGPARPRHPSGYPRVSRERNKSLPIANNANSDTGSARYGGGSRMQIFNDATSDKSGRSSVDLTATDRTSSVNGSIRSEQLSTAHLVTARFKHTVTVDGHAVITGRDGDVLQRCEDEPIHIPGAVQSFGLLIAFEESKEGELVARVVSENSHRIIGYHPQEIFKLSSFTEILSEEQAENLLDHIDFIRDEEADPATNGPEVFTISIKSRSTKKSQKLWCAMHIHPDAQDLIICEFELDDDQCYPLVPLSEDTPDHPEDTLNSMPTHDEYVESTHISSKPLRVLRSARKRKGEAAAMEVFNIMSQVQEQLASAPNLETFLKILVGVVKELTGFHRVMIYQFDAAFNGRVVTELVDPRATKDLYKGLNFPASDIPKQARDLYKVNKVRLLYDRGLETSRLVCRTVEDLERPLDLSFSYLRAMSPIHIKYLANMAVRSSMSISINAFNELWGLIACHSYGSKGMRVSFPIRKMCRLVGDTASRNIERLSYASRLQARKLINTVPTQANPSGYIIASSDDLLKLFDADFGLLSIHGETKILGLIEQSQEALAMLEYLRLRKLTSVLTSQDVRIDFPDLVYPPGFDVIAGLLLVPLSVGGNDFIVFFRKGQIKEVKWAGNPYEKFIKEGTEGYLEPRKSFKTWSETVIGKCREWTEEQVETAAVLCLVYGKFIEVWRQKEAAIQSSSLTRLLLANSAHEVRTPLNAIINYLEIALEGSLDQETRDNLAKSHSASKSLIYVINDLLDLTKAEEGKALIRDETFNLPATIREATDAFLGEAKRKELTYEVSEQPGVPQWVIGDQRRVRQAVANITENAMKHTTSGFVRVEIWHLESHEDKVTVEIVIQDSGCGMSNEKLDGLFRDLEQVTTDSGLMMEDSNVKCLSDMQENRTLGLGLAMVARTVRNMDGQLRLKSEEGKGSRFVIQLPFLVPAEEQANSRGSSVKSMISPSTTPSRAMHEGEVTLVEKTSSLRAEGVIRRRSLEEIASLRSFRTGSSNKSNNSQKSDVDRLIDAISGPLSVGEPENDELQLQRTNSRHSAQGLMSAGGLRGLSRSVERPGKLARSTSYGTPQLSRNTYEGPPGAHFVTDNKTLLKAVRIPDEFNESERTTPTPSMVLFRISNETSPQPSREDSPSQIKSQPAQLDADKFQVLVAEDDPVNSRIIRKRLEKSGHEVHHTVNGEDCATAYGEEATFFDVVLMDMQMPIVDGLTSTKMIRSIEKTHPERKLSQRAALNGRVPIFAVSASLLERDRESYINAGFDGWILKPVDFKRLNKLLLGIVDEDTRASCLYRPGNWEQGGWFTRRQPSRWEANTIPSDGSCSRKESLQGSSSGISRKASNSESGTTGTSDSGTLTPTTGPQQKQIVGEDCATLAPLNDESDRTASSEVAGCEAAS